MNDTPHPPSSPGAIASLQGQLRRSIAFGFRFAASCFSSNRTLRDSDGVVLNRSVTGLSGHRKFFGATFAVNE